MTTNVNSVLINNPDATVTALMILVTPDSRASEPSGVPAEPHAYNDLE